jgi:sulfur carrier protein
VEIHVNDETREVPDDISLLQLISNLHLAPERIAIEVNHDVVRRARWPSTVLKEGDRVEIVHFVGGGRTVGRRQEAGGSDLQVVTRGQ